MTDHAFSPADDARKAAIAPSRTFVRLRPITSALSMLVEFGGTVPQAVDEARALLRVADQMNKSERPAAALTYAREVMVAADPSKALSAAAKGRATERERAEIAAHLYEAASERVQVVYGEHRDRMVDQILASPKAAQMFGEVERAVADVRPGSLAQPNPENLDDAAAVAILRRAASAYDRLRTRMVALDLLPWDETQGLAGLLYADPTDADPQEVRRALKGVRPGTTDLIAWTTSLSEGPAARPVSPRGVPAAILNGTPGVVLSPATSLDEYERRVRLASRPSATASRAAGPGAGAGPGLIP